eukprot:365917-Chlamydomonas_euryale.AAC.4
MDVEQGGLMFRCNAAPAHQSGWMGAESKDRVTRASPERPCVGPRTHKSVPFFRSCRPVPRGLRTMSHSAGTSLSGLRGRTHVDMFTTSRTWQTPMTAPVTCCCRARAVGCGRIPAGRQSFIMPRHDHHWQRCASHQKAFTPYMLYVSCYVGMLCRVH